MLTRILIAISLLVILGVPFVVSLGRAQASYPAGTETLVVTTPHVQQIRDEFARAFGAWHERHYGSPVRVDYRTPGGTSEIIRGLQAQARAAFSNGKYEVLRDASGGVVGARLTRGAVDTDLLFGGGSFDHGKTLVGDGVSVRLTINGEEQEIKAPLSRPTMLGFDTDAEADAFLAQALGENAIGPKKLYHPERYWVGTALSSFGIVYNADVLEHRLGGADLPDEWEDLGDPALRGWVALADPRQSGSITTTFDSILGNLGWDKGWHVLRAMCGNARYFTGSSTKPPTDVSQGEAALGLAIDFYGRGQAQTAGRGRVGYIEPKGAVLVDADPVSVIAGGPNPQLADRFARFCLTEEAQAIWQFHPTTGPSGSANPANPETGEPMGPDRNALRRMPVRRSMYAKHFDHFIDKVDPFEIVSDNEEPGWRTGVQVMMGCFAIDTHSECARAWAALARARADASFSPDALSLMDGLFFAWPGTPVDANGAFTTRDAADVLAWNERNYRDVRNAWRPPGAQRMAEIYYTRFFKAAYERVVQIAENPEVASMTTLEELIQECAADAGLLWSDPAEVLP